MSIRSGPFKENQYEKNIYKTLENYMFSCMKDSAYDQEHIYRVLYNALRIAKTE